MPYVIADLSPSLDGFIAGEGVSVERPFGGAELALYRWHGLEGDDREEADRRLSESHLDDAGAIVLGRTMFEVGIGPWGPDGAFRRPCFVVTHRPESDVVRGPTTFTFVPDLADALDRAATAAGDKAVMVVGGASLVRQALAAGRVDELRLHVAPLLLGAGPSIFAGEGDLGGTRLELIDATPTSTALHVRYRVLR